MVQITAFSVRNCVAVNCGLQLILKLPGRAEGDVEKAKKFTLTAFCATFGKVGACRQRGFYKLSLQGLKVGLANPGNSFVNVNKEFMRFVEYQKLPPKYHASNCNTQRRLSASFGIPKNHSTAFANS
jgi:hypothetical protein